MLSLTGTCCLAICPFFFFFFVPLKFRFSFLYVCPASVLLLLLSTQCTPACSTLTFAAVLHPSKLRSSMRPLLDCVQLTALRPRGSPGQWPSTKAPGASSTSATKFPAAQGDSRSKSHSPAKHTLYIHTDARTHWCLSGLSCHLRTVLLGERRSYAFVCERERQRDIQ